MEGEALTAVTRAGACVHCVGQSLCLDCRVSVTSTPLGSSRTPFLSSATAFLIANLPSRGQPVDED